VRSTASPTGISLTQYADRNSFHPDLYPDRALGHFQEFNMIPVPPRRTFKPFERKSSYIITCHFLPAFLSLLALWLDPDLIDKGFCYYSFILGKSIKKFKIKLAVRKLCFARRLVGVISYTAIMTLEAECVRTFLGEDEVSVSLSSSSTNHTDHVSHFFPNS